MAIDEPKLWRFFTLVYEGYLKPTQALCRELAEGRLDRDALSDQSIQPNSEISSLSENYYWLGRAHREKNESSKKLNPYRDNMHHQWVGLADHFHSQLKASLDTPNLGNAQEVARRFAEKFAQLNVQDLKAEVELACKLLSSQPDGKSAPNQPDVISYYDIAVLKGITKKRVQSCASEWRKQYDGIADPCSYAKIRPLLLKQWPGREALFPVDYAEMRKILEIRKADKHPDR